MKLKLNETTYDVPSSFTVEITDDGESRELKIRGVRKGYYESKYGDGDAICLNSMVGAALQRTVNLETVSEKDGLKAREGDLHVLVEQIKAPSKPKKAKVPSKSKNESEESEPNNRESEADSD